MKKGNSRGHYDPKDNTGKESKGDFLTKISFKNVPFIMKSPKLTVRKQTKT